MHLFDVREVLNSIMVLLLGKMTVSFFGHLNHSKENKDQAEILKKILEEVKKNRPNKLG